MFMCQKICQLDLQALVEVNSGSVRTGLSYLLLQVFFQAAHFQGATKRMLNVVNFLPQVC